MRFLHPFLWFFIQLIHTIRFGTVNSYFQHYWFGWVIYESNRLWGAKIKFTVAGKKINKWLLVDRLSQFYRFTTNTFYSIPTHSIVTAATKLGQGNIFTSVCQEFCPQGGGGCLPQCMLGYTTPPPRADNPPPRRQTAAYGQRAAGTHPTGMHSSCWSVGWSEAGGFCCNLLVNLKLQQYTFHKDIQSKTQTILKQ